MNPLFENITFTQEEIYNKEENDIAKYSQCMLGDSHDDLECQFEADLEDSLFLNDGQKFGFSIDDPQLFGGDRPEDLSGSINATINTYEDTINAHGSSNAQKSTMDTSPTEVLKSDKNSEKLNGVKNDDTFSGPSPDPRPVRKCVRSRAANYSELAKGKHKQHFTRWKRENDTKLCIVLDAKLRALNLSPSCLMVPICKLQPSVLAIIEQVIAECNWRGGLDTLMIRLRKLYGSDSLSVRQKRMLRQLIAKLEESGQEIDFEDLALKFPGKTASCLKTAYNAGLKGF